MSLAYIIYQDNERNSGISKKSLQQVSCLNKIGLKSDLIVVNRREDISNKNHNDINNYRDIFLGNIVNKISHRLSYENRLSKIIRHMQTVDIVYMRYPYSPLLSPFIYRRPGRSSKIVLEFNTIYINEMDYKGFISKFYKFWESVFGNIAIGQIDGIVGVTDEITDYYSHRVRAGNIPHITIGNGIDVNSIKIRTPPLYDHSELNIIAVANISYWHALDRLLNGISDYSGDVCVRLHIVGNGPEKQNLMDAVHRLHLESNVIFHGFLTGEKLDMLYDLSHIAIGSLGLHRIGMKESTSLKAREYCARGIPFVLSNSDPDFPPTFPFVIRVPSNESDIDINGLIESVSKQYGVNEHHLEMRRYAENKLDWSVKMIQLKTFLKSLE